MCIRNILYVRTHLLPQFWSDLRVPMEFLSPGEGFKTICKVMGPEMKKKYWRPT